jgi:hypothetical protein
MTIRAFGKEFTVKFYHVRDKDRAKVDAISYGIKPKLALTRIVGETVCAIREADSLVSEGRAFQSVLEQGGFSPVKGQKEAFREAIKLFPRPARKALWEQFRAA